MEKKQLNFNAPLLSVRKPTSKFVSSDVKNKLSAKSGPIRQQSLPVKRSEWELGEVAKPGAVPFRWEQIPGRTKGEYEDQSEDPKRSTSAPRLPPGRLPDAVRGYSGERCNDPKIARRFSGERSSDQKGYRHQSQVCPVNDHAALIASLKESLNANEESDSGSVDDAYSDAIDTLSPTASFSFNCSVSGLSGFEVPNMKQNGTFDVDPMTRDFMMSRFLPAAKAAVVETPQFVPKKQPAAIEQPNQQPKKVVSGERKPLLDQSETDIMSYYNEFAQDVQSEHEGGQCNEQKKRPGKAWGIFPRLCVKKSLCLFNPVPSIKTKPQVPKSPPTDVGRLTRRAFSGPLDKQGSDANNRRIFHSGVLTRELPRVETKPAETKQFAHTSYRIGGLSPCRPFRSGEISPYRNATPQSPFRKGARFLGLPKEADPVTAEKYSSLYKKCSNLLDAAPPRISRPEGVSPNEVVEKTLYVDSVTTVHQMKDLASSKAERHVDSSGEELKTSAETKRMQEILKPAKNGNEGQSMDDMDGETKLDCKAPLLAQEVLRSSAWMTKLGAPADKTAEALELNKNFSKDARLLVKNDDAFEVEKDANAVALQSPLAPPLPKSPSESWLWRTLPSIHLRIPFSPSHNGKNFHIKKVDQKAPNPGTKWETIVKSSNFDHHSRYSEENFPRVSHKKNKV